MSITIYRPCQMHDHWREREVLRTIAPHQSCCEYTVVMPNRRHPVLDASDKNRYRAEIMRELPSKGAPSLLMTCQLTPGTLHLAMSESRACGVFAWKAYSQGVTTNSEYGVEEWDCPEMHRLVAIAEHIGIPILLHLQDKTPNPLDGELTALVRAMPLIEAHKGVLWCLEHLSTGEAIDYVETLQAAGFSIACTLTMHHALRCSRCNPTSPMLKVQPPLQTCRNCERVLAAILSGKHIKGRDAAAHPAEFKDQPLDKAPSGIWTPDEVDIPLTYQTFRSNGGRDWSYRFSKFMSGNAHAFYGERMPARSLPPIELVEDEWIVDVPTSPVSVVPFMAGELLRYRLVG